MSEGRIGPPGLFDILGAKAPSFHRVKFSQCLHFGSGFGWKISISLSCIDLGNSFQGLSVGQFMVKSTTGCHGYLSVLIVNFILRFKPRGMIRKNSGGLLEYTLMQSRFFGWALTFARIGFLVSSGLCLVCVAI